MLQNETAYAISQLLSGILFLLLGLFVLTRNPKNKIYITFFIFCLSLATWAINYYFWIATSQNVSLSFLFFKLLMMGAIFIHMTHFHAVLHLFNLVKKFLKPLVIGYMLSGFFTYLNFSNMLYSNFAQKKLFFTNWPDANIFTTSFLIIEIFYMTLSTFIIFKQLFRFNKPAVTEYIVLFIITPFSFAGGLTNWFLWYNIPIPPIGNPLVALYPLVVMFIILKYQHMDIKIAVRRSLIYSILVTTITVFYFLVVSFFENIFRGFVGYKSLPLTFATIGMFALLFQPLKNNIQAFVDKYFFKGTLDDIKRENVHLMDELQRSEKMRAVGTLAAGLAHEIKNPLTSIKTFTEFLDEKYADKEFREKFKRIVGTEVERINSIVQQLLDFAKPRPLSLKDTDVHNILDDTLNFLNNELIKKRINLIKEYNQKTIIINADPNQLRQVFLNIALNAIDAMKHGGKLSISTRANDGGISIRISDTGCGISRQDLHHIFDPFYSTKDSGSGLGLSIVHNIIQEHKGRISVESETGKGTTFEILL